MALDLNWSPSSQSIVQFSDQLAIALEEVYPKTASLLNAAKTGTLLLLNAREILKFGDGSASFKIGHDGDDPQQTWAAYKDVISQWLKENVNDEACLGPARDAVAEELSDSYYAKYPRWPDPGEKWAKHTMRVMTRGEYPWPNKSKPRKQIGFACSGPLDIWDETTASRQFYCNIESPKVYVDGAYRRQRMKMQYVKLDFYDLKQLERDLQDPEFYQLKLKIVTLTQNQMARTQKQVTYENIDELADNFKSALAKMWK